MIIAAIVIRLHLWNDYYMPGTIQNDVHTFTHSVITTTHEGGDNLISITEAMEKCTEGLSS